MLSGLENPVHLAIVLVIALLVFGAKRLPEMGQGLGAGLRNFKDGLTARPDGSEDGRDARAALKE